MQNDNTPDGHQTSGEREAEAAKKADRERRAIRKQQNGWTARAVIITVIGFILVAYLLGMLVKRTTGDFRHVCWTCIGDSVGLQVDKLTGERGDVPTTAPDGTPYA